jgi:hypothetical protein
MTYQAIGSAPQELYFHYDALGNTSLITDANSNPKASFQYDLHTGRLINSWNPSNLEIINLEDGIIGSINITAYTAIGKDIILPPKQPPNLGGSTNGDNWGSVEIAPDGARIDTDLTDVSRFGKDCGGMTSSSTNDISPKRLSPCSQKEHNIGEHTFSQSECYPIKCEDVVGWRGFKAIVGNIEITWWTALTSKLIPVAEIIKAANEALKITLPSDTTKAEMIGTLDAAQLCCSKGGKPVVRIGKWETGKKGAYVDCIGGKNPTKTIIRGW